MSLAANSGSANASTPQFADDPFHPVSELEVYVQKKSAQFVIYLDICTLVPTILMVILYGAYSNRVGRKLPLICPVVGQLIKYSIYVITMKYRLVVIPYFEMCSVRFVFHISFLP